MKTTQENKKFYLKQRFNPQLGMSYEKLGQISEKEARRYIKKSIYGSNKIMSFESECDYDAAIALLKSEGESVL